MRVMNISGFLGLGLLVTLLVGPPGAAVAQTPKVEKSSVPYTAPTDGQGMYRTYCAVCHGVRGKGDGPAAPAMKQKVTDLTMLAKSNGGKFPEERVYNSIAGDANLPAHGSSEMPTWGYIFKRISSSTDEREAVVRLKTLTEYVKKIQAK